MLEHESVLHCLLWLNYISSCGCTFNLSIQQRLDISTVSTLGLLWTMLLWTFIYKFQVVICFQFKLSILKYREGNGTPLQYSCLENPMDRGAWKATVHGVAEGWIGLSNFTFTFHFDALEKEITTHSSILAWRIPWMEEPGRLQSTGSQRVRHNWATFTSLQRMFMKPFFWAAFKELIILWKRRHVYKTRQNERVQ